MTDDHKFRLEHLPPEMVRRLDEDCRRFEASLARGEAPRIEDFLHDVEDSLRPVWFEHLLDLEVCHRRRGEEPPTLDEYHGRFPGYKALVDTVFGLPERSSTKAGPCSETDGGPPRPPGRVGMIELLVHEGAMRPPAQAGILASLGRFEILRVLGSGGMGIVFQGRDPVTGTQVAIKMFRPDLRHDSRLEALFRREAQCLSHLAHPSILTVSEAAGRDAWPYFVTPFHERGSLARSIGGRPMKKELILKITRQIATALAYAHARGVLHRDVKPGNILIGEDGTAYLADFGLARPMSGDSWVDLEYSHCIGTVPYMPPRVAGGEAEDSRCDIYSFGAVLHEMLTGRAPYVGRSSQDLLRQVKAAPPEPVLLVNPHADRDLARIAESAMARELRNRYASMSDVIADLDRVARGEPSLGAHPPELRLRTRRLLLSGLSLAAVAPAALSLILVSWPAPWNPLYRRIPAGELDPRFGDGGRVFTDFGASTFDRADTMVLQDDGKIVVAGASGEESMSRDFALARYLPEGRLDDDFGIAGKSVANMGHTFELVGSLALQSDGKIVAVGCIGPAHPDHAPPLRCDWAVARFDPAGRLDKGFGDGGKVISHFDGRDMLTGVTIQPQDGKIVTVGIVQPPGETRRIAVARYLHDGSPDRSFGRDGLVFAHLSRNGPSDDCARCVVLQPDGKIVVAGYSSRSPDDPADFDFAILRLNTDGSLDDESQRDETPRDRFGSEGFVTVNFGGRDEAWGIVLRSNGKLVVGGFSWEPGSYYVKRGEPRRQKTTLGIKLAGLLPDGRLDDKFGTGGRMSHDTLHNERVFAMTLTPDEKIVVVSSCYPIQPDPSNMHKPHFRMDAPCGVTRFHPDGRFDETFGKEGQRFFDLDSLLDAGEPGLAIDREGNILVSARSVRKSTDSDFVLLRILGEDTWIPKWKSR